MKTYLEKIKDVYDMSAKGQLLDAFEKYYHNDVVMVEATGETRKGKDANRKFQKEFMGTVKEFHGMGVKSATSNEDEKTTMVESWMDATMNDGKRMKMEEVAVQKWSGDQIIHERFYYNAAKP
jgi:ketosteroid isomerase-like protein